MSAEMTLDEIRSGHTRVRLLSEEDERAFVAKNFPRLLEIAQEMRAEIGRLKVNAIKHHHIAEVFGGCPMACRTVQVYQNHHRNAQEFARIGPQLG